MIGLNKQNHRLFVRFLAGTTVIGVANFSFISLYYFSIPSAFSISRLQKAQELLINEPCQY